MDVREKLSRKKWLIDANSLLDEFLKRYTERERNRNLVFAACEIKQDFADMISNAPTVDAVEVVRCRECKFGDWDSEPNDAMVCMRTKDGFWRSGNDFCSFGERKEGAD